MEKHTGAKSQAESTSSFLGRTFLDPYFTNITELSVTPQNAGHILIRKYPKFRIDGLSDDRVIRMCSLSSKLSFLRTKVDTLVTAGELAQAALLRSQLDFITNPDKSRKKETNIEYLMENTGGSVRMTTGLLGINSPTAPDWIEFIVRTWGKSPADYQKKPELKT